MDGLKKELLDNILPFWIHKMVDNKNGGFYGQIDGKDILHPEANKGAVLNARILWTFSVAYRIFGDKEYLETATRAYDYINSYLVDKEFGGVYWETDYKGNPVNTKKQVYAQGFALYGFSEYYRATGKREALDLAIDLFHLIEKYKDKRYGGYFEAFTREWQPIDDMRLSEKDANEKKSMNTHLHILEPYTNLLRVWKDEELKQAQKDLIRIFSDNILDGKTYHQNLFFAEDWTVKSSAISYGHDIEASWLLFEAAEVLDDKEIVEEIRQLSINVADAASEGLEADGSMIYEKDGGHTDRERHWWVQAEAIVGYMYAYKNSGDINYKKRAARIWQYIQNNLADRQHGEWHWSRMADGAINRKDDKAGFWKCPYHNSRMCMEMIEHFDLR
ncbi:AGE family epimerase/isomerase [Dysgonomonas sp. 511]|uniref:AGE family epimerase/isomerase n=1 Tax=Dysgonomonas sp. 511 TaxID=2302930 RepID=UPI0013D126AE|nr:AGE family epimerase/isomerase [Dysgonomonas sp. 511]NDV77405.1 N-acyl-D-glucosamine 2-epimerase [Dysgonomonas sp. 511]